MIIFVWSEDGYYFALHNHTIRADKYGNIFGGGGGGTTVVEAPKPSDAELAILNEQLELMKDQKAAFDELKPLYMEQTKQQIEFQQKQIEYYEQLLPIMTESQKQQYEVMQQQLALQSRQMKLIEEEMADARALKPLILQEMGIVAETDKKGNVKYRKMTEEEYKATLNPVELQAYENLKLALERQAKALRGELPISETTKQQKEQEFEQLKEAMARAGHTITGDTPETATADTTAGIQSLKAFQQKWAVIEEAERRGELTAGAPAALQQFGMVSDAEARRTGLMAGYPQLRTGLAAGYGGQVVPLTTGIPQSAGILSQYQPLLSGYSSLLQPYQYQRGLEFQANVANAQAQAQTQSSLFKGLGSLFGTGLGFGVYKLLSGRQFKKDIKKQRPKDEEKAIDMIKDIDTYTYRYKGEGNVPKRMGMMADNAPALLTNSNKTIIDIPRTIGLLTVAMKALANKVEKLEKRGGK